ncbi:MAG: carbohydrate ABC transporter permease [Anaerolineae bacterium]|jgi:multiple sugar transport system permease protein/putative aldouronate transport system permease protein|nr:carbohydrate ABC transporter permease [Anaerolineae bacterium]
MTAEAKAAYKPRNKIRETGVDRAFNAVNYSILAVFLVVILYPLIYVVSASLSDGAAVISGRVVLWPVDFSLVAYQKIFAYERVWTGYGNSLFYAVVGTLVNVTMTLIAAYPLSRRDLPGRNIILGLFLFTLFFSGGLIPTYLLVKDLGLRNTRWALIIPQALSIWNLLIAITFMRTSIPHELLEASQLDGCSDFQYFTRILLPLSTPLIAVLALFYAIGHWNQFFAALLYLTNKDLFPLQIILRDILISSQVDMNMMEDLQSMAAREAMRELLKYALIVVASVPVLIIYPFAQRYFVKGIMLGSVKG